MMRAPVTALSVRKSLASPDTAWRRLILRMVGTGCQSLSQSLPRVYLLVAATFGLVGFAYLMLFPCLVLTSGYGLYEVLFTNQSIEWSHVLIWLAIGALSILVSYRTFQFRPVLPAGILLNEEKAPSLYELVKGQLAYYRRTRIDRIIVSNEFELGILNTPKWAFPVDSTATLVIGLPLISSLSVSQFHCALARRLGQFSKRYNWLENWLYQLREIWPQYCDRSQKYGSGYQLVEWFFLVYAPVYKVVAMPAARLDELAADNYAMELFNDEVVLDTITTQTLCDSYLAVRSRPITRNVAVRHKQSLNELHSGMVSAIRAGLKGEKPEQWLAKTLSAEEQWDDAMPSLARRVENIGHTQVRMAANVSESAANVYLGAIIDHYLG